MPDPLTALDAAQLVAALRSEGPLTQVHLKSLLGAHFWAPGRFEAAVAAACARGWVTAAEDGRLTAR